MSTETVYRVEDGLTHRGPYHVDDNPAQVPERLLEDGYGHSRFDRCPTPREDDMDPPEDWEGVRFGFTSLEQLKEWFLRSARALLHDRDFVVGVYEAERTEHGNKQCIFWFDGATRTDELSLGEV